MLSYQNFGLSEYAEKPRFWVFCGFFKNPLALSNLNNSEIFRLSFEDIFLGTLDTYTKKMNPPSAVLGGGGCMVRSAAWLIAYMDVYGLLTVK